MQVAGMGLFPGNGATSATSTSQDDDVNAVTSTEPVHEHIRLRQDPKSIEPMFLREAITELYRQYDQAQSGYIDHDQITSMVYEIKVARRRANGKGGVASGLTWAGEAQIADGIIDALDRDGNRKIDEKEFTSWLIGRICAHHEHRDNSHGKVSCQYVSFTSAIMLKVATLTYCMRYR